MLESVPARHSYSRTSRLGALRAAVPICLLIGLAVGCDGAAIVPDGTQHPTESQVAPGGSAGPADGEFRSFKAVVLAGTGNSVPKFRIPRDAVAIAKISHRGSSNFVVWTLDRSGTQVDLLVNTIGNYQGTVLFDEQADQHSVAFQIDADGPWKIRILPLTKAEHWNGHKALTGRGDFVVVLDPPSEGLTTTVIQHGGSSNFAVWAYGETPDLLVNEIGQYRGESLMPAGTLVLEITADGRWRFTALR